MESSNTLPIVPKVSNSVMNFSEVMFYENYLTSNFHTNTVISRRVCLLVEMVLKTVTIENQSQLKYN